jgi:hypothetical protein
VQIDDDTGNLYPPHSEVMAYDPHGEHESKLSSRLAGETLKPGMYLLLPYLNDVGLGGARAKEGYYSAIWKQKLSEKLRINDRVLEQNLRNAGVKLTSLHSCMYHWARPSTTVIHAPQTRRHFEILIETLGLNSLETRKGSVQIQWWHSAWNEIAKARGVAIQTGMEGQDIIDESLRDILREMIPAIAAKAEEGESFELDIPADAALTGTVSFYKVIGIEAGFRAPEVELKSVADLKSFEQWRD